MSSISSWDTSWYPSGAMNYVPSLVPRFISTIEQNSASSLKLRQVVVYPQAKFLILNFVLIPVWN